MPSCSSEVKPLRRDPLTQWKRMMENNIECLESSRNLYTERHKFRSAQCSHAYLRGNVDCLQRPLYDVRHPSMDKRQICNLSEKLVSYESVKHGDIHCRITRYDVPNQNYNIITDTKDSEKITMGNQKGTKLDNSETVALCNKSLTLGSSIKSLCDEDIQKSLQSQNIRNTVCHKIDFETHIEDRKNFLDRSETVNPTDRIIDAYYPHLFSVDFVCDTRFYSNHVGNIESVGANTYTQNTECMGSYECAAFSKGAGMFTVDKHKEADGIYKQGRYLPSEQTNTESANTGCKAHSCFQSRRCVDNGQSILNTGKVRETHDDCFLNIGDVDNDQSMCNTDKDRKSHINGDEGQITLKAGTDSTPNNNLHNAQSSLNVCKDRKTNNVIDCKTNNHAKDCKTNDNVEDCRTNNIVENCKANNNVQDCKTNNSVQDCKTNNNVINCKANINVQDCKTNNNADDCKTSNDVDNAYSFVSAWTDCKTHKDYFQNARDVNNGQSIMNRSKAGTQEFSNDEKFDVRRCLKTTDQNRFGVDMDSSANFKNAYDNQNITNKLEYTITSSERIMSDERKILEIPQTCTNVDFDLCSEDIDSSTANDFSDTSGIKEHVDISLNEISNMTSEVDCLQDTVKHTKYTVACRLSSCDFTDSEMFDEKINPVKEGCGTLIPCILKSEGPFTNTADKTHKNKSITHPGSVTSVYDNTSLAKSIHKTEANNSIIDCCCEGCFVKKKPISISSSECTLILPNIPYKSHRQTRACRSSSLENIVQDDMKKSQTCLINNMKQDVKNRIAYNNSSCSKDEHISSVSGEEVLRDHLTAGCTQNYDLLRQKSLEQISQNFSLSPALNRKNTMLDYEQKLNKTVKHLTRNPMTQWTRLVNDNIEAVFRTQSDPQHGCKNLEASNLNKTEHPQRSQSLNTEKIKSGRADIANVQIKSQKHCFKNKHSSESSGINSNAKMLKMYGLHDSLTSFEQKDSTDCHETDSSCVGVKCHEMEASSLSMNILEDSKIEISEPLGTDDRHWFSTGLANIGCSYSNDCKDTYCHERENSDVYDKKDDEIMLSEKYGNVYENHETAEDVDILTTLSNSQFNTEAAVLFTLNSVHKSESTEAKKDIINKHANIIFLEEGKEDSKNLRVCNKHEQCSEDKCVQIEECMKCGFRPNDKVEGDCRHENMYSHDCHHDNRTEMIIDEVRVQNMHMSKMEDCEVDQTEFGGGDSGVDQTHFECGDCEVDWTECVGGDCKIDQTAVEGRYSGVDRTHFGGGDCEVDQTKLVDVDSEGDRTYFKHGDCVVDWTKFGGGDCEIDQTHFVRRDCEVDWTKFGGGDCEVDRTEFEGRDCGVDQTEFGGEVSEVDWTEFGGRDSRADRTQFGEGDCEADKKKLVEDNWESLQTSQSLNTENKNSEHSDFINVLRQDDCSTEKENEVVYSVDGYGKKNCNSRECIISMFIHSETSEKQCTDKESNSLVKNDSDSYDKTEVSKDEVSAHNVTTSKIINVSESTTVASQDDSVKGGASYKNTSYDKCMTNCVIEASEKVKTNECETNIFPGVTVSEFDCHDDEFDVDIAADILGIHVAKEHVYIPEKNQFMRQCSNVCQQDTTINTRDKIDTQVFSCGIPANENLHDRNSGRLATNSSILDVSGITETYSNFCNMEEHIVTCTQHSGSVASLHGNATLGDRMDETINSLVRSISRIVETSSNFSNAEDNIVTCTHHSGSVATLHDDNIMGERTDKTKACKPVLDLSCGNSSYKNAAFVNRNACILSLPALQHSTCRTNKLYESTSADNLATKDACRSHVFYVWSVKPNNVHSKSDTEIRDATNGMSDTEIRSATNRKCVTESGSATSRMYDTEVGIVNNGQSETENGSTNNNKSDTEIKSANNGMHDTEIRSASNGKSDNEISYNNNGKCGPQIWYINNEKCETEIRCADNEMYDTEIRSVNNGKSHTENGSADNDKSDTEIRNVNNDKSDTQIRSVNNRKSDTEISFANSEKCDTDIRDVNKGKWDTDIGCDNGKEHAEINYANKGIYSAGIKGAKDEQCLKPLAECLGHVWKDRYDEKDNRDLLQVVEKAAAEVTQLQTSQVKELKAVHPEDSRTTVKTLTRNPVTQWTRLVNANIEAVVRNKANTADKKWYGSSPCEPCGFSKSGSLETNLDVSIENIQSGSWDASTVQFKHDDYCYETLHMKECSELRNKNICNLPAIICSLNSQEFNTSCLQTVSDVAIDTCSDNKVGAKCEHMNMTVSQKIEPEKIEVAERDKWQSYFINLGSTRGSCNQDCTESDHHVSEMNAAYAQQEVKVTVDDNCGCVISEDRSVDKAPVLSVSKIISGETKFCTKPICETVCVGATKDTRQEDNIPFMKKCKVYSENSNIRNVLEKQCDYFYDKNKNEPNSDEVCTQDFPKRRISDVSESLKINEQATIYGFRDITDSCGNSCNDKYRENKIIYISTSNDTIHTKQPDTMQVLQKDISDCELNSCSKNFDFEMKCMPNINEATQLVSVRSDKEINIEGEENLYEKKVVSAIYKSEVQELSHITIPLEENVYKDKVVSATCKSETQVLSNDITISREENQTTKTRTKTVIPFIINSIAIVSKDSDENNKVNYTQQSRNNVSLLDDTDKKNKYIDKRENHSSIDVDCESALSKKNSFRISRSDHTLILPTFSHSVFQENRLYKSTSAENIVTNDKHKTRTCQLKVMKHKKLNRMSNSGMRGAVIGSSLGKLKAELSGDSCRPGCIEDDKTTSLQCLQKTTANVNQLHSLKSKDSEGKNYMVHTEESFSEGRKYMMHSEESLFQGKNCMVCTEKSLCEGKNNVMHTEKSLSEGKNNMIQIEKSLSEGKNNMMHTEKSLSEGKNNMMHTERSLSEGNDNMMHTEKTHSEGKNNTMHTEKSLCEGKNNRIQIERSLSEGKNNMMHTEKSLSEGKNNMMHTVKSHSEGNNNTVHTEKSLSEEKNNMMHTEKSLSEERNYMVHSEESLSEGNNNMVHIELSEGKNKMMHTEKSLSEGKNNMMHTEKSLTEGKNNIMHTKESLTGGRSYMVHTVESYETLKNLARNPVTRTLKQLTRNPMTQWTRLVNNNIEAVSKRKVGKSGLAKCGGGDFEASTFVKKKSYIFPEKVLGITSSKSESTESAEEKLHLSEPESAKNATEKLCLSESESAKSGTEKYLSEPESAKNGTEKYLSQSESAKSGTDKCLNESESAKSGTEKYLNESESAKSATEKVYLSESESAKSATEKVYLSESELAKRGTEKWYLNELESAKNKTELYLSEPESGKRGREWIYLSESESAKSGTEKYLSESESAKSGTEKYLSELESAKSGTDKCLNESESAKSGTENYLNESESAKSGTEKVYLSESESAKSATNKLYLRESEPAKHGIEKYLSESESAISATDKFLSSDDISSFEEVSVMPRIPNTCADCMEETPEEKVKSMSSDVCLYEQTIAVQPLHLVHDEHLLVSKTLSLQNRTTDVNLAETEIRALTLDKTQGSTFDSVPLSEVKAAVNPRTDCVQYVTCQSDNSETDSSLWPISSEKTDAKLQCISISQQQIQPKFILNQLNNVNLARPLWHCKRPLNTLDVTIYVHKSKCCYKLSSTKKIIDCDQVCSRGKLKQHENNSRTDKSKNQNKIFSRDRQKYPSTDENKVQDAISSTIKRKYQENISRTDKSKHKKDKIAGLQTSKEKYIVSSKDSNVLKLGIAAQISENYDRISSSLSTRHTLCSATAQGRAIEVLDELSCEDASSNSGWSRFWYFIANMFTGFSKPLPHQNDVENQELMIIQSKQMGKKSNNSDHKHKVHCFKGKWGQKYNESRAVLFNINSLHNKEHMVEDSSCITNESASKKHRKLKVITGIELITGEESLGVTESDKMTAKSEVKLSKQKKSSSGNDWREPTENILFRDQVGDRCVETGYLSKDKNIEKCSYVLVPQDHSNNDTQIRQNHDKSESQTVSSGNKNTFTDNKEFSGFGKCKQGLHKSQIPVFVSRYSKCIVKDLENEKITSCHQKEADSLENKGQGENENETTAKHHNFLETEIFDLMKENNESEQNDFCACQTSADKTFNISGADSEDTTAPWKEFSLCHGASEMDGTLHEMGAAETDGTLPVRNSASIKKDASNIIQFQDTSARIRDKFSVNAERMSKIGNIEPEQEHLCLCQTREDQTCNISMDESVDKTAIFDDRYQCENTLENDATLHEIGVAETDSRQYSIMPVRKSASIKEDTSNIIQFLDTPARIKEKVSINTESMSNDEHLGDYFQNLVTLNQKVADIGPDLRQHGQGCSKDEHCDLTESELLQSSLECLLEMLLQRGKVTHAFITNTEGEVLAKTAKCSVTAQDINSILFSLFSSYRGMVKITVFDDVYTCFKHDEHSLVGRASTNIFVARSGQQSIVVGFCDALTPGSCVKEIQEISELLNKRGL